LIIDGEGLGRRIDGGNRAVEPVDLAGGLRGRAVAGGSAAKGKIRRSTTTVIMLKTICFIIQSPR
jgi:hypothetical protein